MKTINLKYGRGEVALTLPAHANCTVLKPEEKEGLSHPQTEVQKALHNPAGGRPLEEVARGKKKAVILASDISRPTPTALMVPPVVEALIQAGLGEDDIKVIFGLGYHRKHTEEEKKQLVGEKIYRRIQCLDHDVDSCIEIGTTSRGTPVEVFKPVAEADLIVATGNIEFHFHAGYTGGYKALLPGVCSKKTIEANHRMMLDPQARAGKIGGNPVREDIEEAGQMAGLDFILNAVLNENKALVDIVAGDPVEAHRRGTECVDRMYKRATGGKADIVVASCGGYPKDLNLYQAHKSLENAALALKEGGSLILLAECSEGLGEPSFEEWMIKASSPEEPVQWIKEGFKLGAHKAAVICNWLQKFKIYLVSGLDRGLVEDIFFTPSETPAEAMEEALKEAPPRPELLILPYAGSTLPRVE